MVAIHRPDVNRQQEVRREGPSGCVLVLFWGEGLQSLEQIRIFG